jgi:hypothetical protein
MKGRDTCTLSSTVSMIESRNIKVIDQIQRSLIFKEQEKLKRLRERFSPTSLRNTTY